MCESDIQYLSNADGQHVAVVVPIELWREIASERETAYLLRSEAMRQRLLAAKESGEGIPLADVRAQLDL